MWNSLPNLIRRNFWLTARNGFVFISDTSFAYLQIDYAEEQNNELEALKAIYADDLKGLIQSVFLTLN